MAAKSGASGWILLLTDGHPTDVTKPEPYSALKTPQGFKMIEFGIGEDYREDILKALADASGGVLYHVTDADKLPVVMQENAVSQVAGRNITVDFEPSDVRILNYPGPPVKINALENIAKIWGQVTMPEGFKGQLLNVKSPTATRSTGPSKPSTHLQTFDRQKVTKSTLREYATVSWQNSPTTRDWKSTTSNSPPESSRRLRRQ